MYGRLDEQLLRRCIRANLACGGEPQGTHLAPNRLCPLCDHRWRVEPRKPTPEMLAALAAQYPSQSHHVRR